VNDPETGEPLEHSYDQIIEWRIIPALIQAIVSNPFLVDNGFFDYRNHLFRCLANRTIILATPALMSLGNPHTRRAGYFSCYPLGHVEDSIDGIEDMHHKMRKIYLSGGGVGIDVSKLRPKGARVDNGQGRSSGPVGFLQDFDAVTGTTNQGGRRRGALLVQMDWNHPDIREFVKVKNFNSAMSKFIQQLPPDQRPERGGNLSNMNISVNVFGDFWKDENLVNLIAENMWRTGDPGLLFIDNMLEYSPLPPEMEPKFANPCVVGSTKVWTDEGNVPINKLVEYERPVTIWNGYEWSEVVPKKTAENAPLMSVKFDNGSFIVCTPYHKFHIVYENQHYEVEAKDLCVEDLLVPFSFPDHPAQMNNVRVESVRLPEEFNQTQDVYCFNEPKRHTAVFNYTLTGQCSEFLSSANTACNLVTINVAKLASQADTENQFLDLLRGTAKAACYLGNIILTLNEGYPLDEIREKTQLLRPVGVGMSGFHTALLLHTESAKYGDAEAVEFAERTQAHLTFATLAISHQLALALNPKSPIEFNPKFWPRHFEELLDYVFTNRNADELSYLPYYNSITTSQAPTGSTSIFLRNMDTGIEPFYALEQTRRIEDRKEGWKTYTFTPYYLESAFKNDPELKERAESQTALKLTPDEQLNMLGAFQKYIHTGCSKTINLPATATVEDVKRLILKAKDMRLKGFTVYRDGSLDNVITVGKPKVETPVPEADELPPARDARVFTAKSHSLNAHMTLTHDERNRIREVFLAAGGPGADINGIFTAFGMILSVALRKAPSLFEPLVKVLCKVRMDQRVVINTGADTPPVVGTSLPQALGHLMIRHQAELSGVQPERLESVSGGFDICPECHELTLKREGSCLKCSSCGYSSC
jgi:ribonucleoside-diphosphate reductase alpha chain